MLSSLSQLLKNRTIVNAHFFRRTYSAEIERKISEKYLSQSTEPDIDRANNEQLLKDSVFTEIPTNINMKEQLSFDQEWEKALPTSQIPGPSNFELIRAFLPGGKYYGLQVNEVHKAFKRDFGNIMMMKGVFGRGDCIILYDPDDHAKVFYTEGPHPVRRAFETVEYYRSNFRQDIFKDRSGVMIDQGELWHSMRMKANPIMLPLTTVRAHVPLVDDIMKEFIETRIELFLKDSKEMPSNFWREINKFSVESITKIGMDVRIGMLQQSTEDSVKLLNAIESVFTLMFDFEILPSVWRIYKTRKFKKLLEAYDTITEIAYKYVNKKFDEMERIGSNEVKVEYSHQGVMEKLLTYDRQFAIIMAMDMIFAGVDTTSTVITNLLYYLAVNPDKQDKLREEILQILPDKDSPLTIDSLYTVPYFRACFKESLRLTPVGVGNLRSAGRDLVLQGFKVPKSVPVTMIVVHLLRDNEQFPNSDLFIPERWLKQPSVDECPIRPANTANPFVFLPFGFGVRSCIGQRFAEMEVSVFVMRLLRDYKVKWNYGPMQYKQSIITIPSSELKFEFKKIN